MISFGVVRGSTTEDTERPLRGNAEELRSRGELGRCPRNRGDRPRPLGGQTPHPLTRSRPYCPDRGRDVRGYVGPVQGGHRIYGWRKPFGKVL